MKSSVSASLNKRDNNAWISEQSHSPPATPSTSWDRRWESPERHLNNTDRRKNRHDEAQDVAVIPRRRHFQTVAEFENEERTLKALIGSAAYELDLQMKKKTSMMNKSSKTAIDESINHTKKRLEKLRNILQELRSHRNLNSSRFCVPKKPPFTASEVRTCQKPAKMSDSPTFYKNSDTWDFGYDSRSRSLSMDAFKYPERLEEDKDAETRDDVSILSGLRSRRSRLRPIEYEGAQYTASTKNMSSPPIVDRYLRLSTAETVGRKIPMFPSRTINTASSGYSFSPPETVGYRLPALGSSPKSQPTVETAIIHP